MTVGKDFFKDFPPISTQEWMDKINADLKGADFERKLVWRTQEGFNVRPFYRTADLEKLNHLGTLPGEFPYVRGNDNTKNEWFIRQDIVVKDPKKANEKALDALNRGADAIGYILECKKDYTKEDIKTLLEGFYLEIIEVNFVHASGKVLPFLLEIFDELGVDKTKLRGSVSFDAFNRLNCKGDFKESAEKQYEKAKMLIELSKEIPHFRIVDIKAKTFNNSGASIVQELGFALAEGVELLNGLLLQGLSIEQITPKIRFHFAVGTTYFMEMAKFRAARLLWAKIVEAYQPSDTEYAKMHIHAENSDWNKTIYDPYVNMLRTQTESMSAIMGGVDSFVLKPFNSVFEDSAEFSERIARNQQLLLKEEVNLDKVVDPAGGSYYIEYLTDAIAENAWKIFLEVQDKGGYVKAFQEGFVQNTINETARKRDMNIATRRENFLGTNQFPNFGEVIEKAAKDKKASKCSCNCANKTTVQGLKVYRGAQAFEQMRLHTDAYAATQGRPKVQMLTIGNLNMRKARAQFACNFFACAGFEVHDHNGFETIDEGVNYCEEQQAKIVVLCSSDDEYASLAPEAFEKLDKNIIFVVAGSPACMDELKEKGIQNFIHVKTNLLESLQEYQKALGI